MAGESVSLFLNPTAGRGRAVRRIARIQVLFDEAGIAVDVRESRAVGDLEEQVRAHVDDGAGRVVVAGGDGSIHEAVNGLLRAGRTAALGVIPIGTGNDFAKACGIPLDWQHATRLLANRLSADASPRRIDVGRMNDRYFANSAGIGFEAKVTRVARSIRWPIGDLVYLLAIFRCMMDDIATSDMHIDAGSVQRTGPVTLVSINNGPWVGGMFYIAPMADNSDGQLEMIIADPVTRRRILSLLPKLIRGQHMGESEVSHHAVRRLSINATAPIPSHLDGEVQPLMQSFDIEILPAALGLL